MKEYKDCLIDILEKGETRKDRTGVGTISLFGVQMKFDLNKGFPLVTTKKTNFDSITHELLWFLSGSENIKYLQDNNVHIWDEWTSKTGNIGPLYGSQWRSWYAHIERPIDQIKEVINSIKKNPYSRRHIVSAWNVEDIFLNPFLALPPCHILFQFYVSNDKKLSCQLYQRSGDFFLGIPFNIASYSLLTHMIAQVCGLEVGEFIHTIGDAHIYRNHINQVNLLLSREPYSLPTLELNPDINDIDSFIFDDIRVNNYNYHPFIKAQVAV